MSLPAITPELRTLYRAKAGERRAAKIIEAGTLRQDFRDANHWRELAAKHGIRLPAWFERPTPGLIRRYLKRLGIETSAYLEYMGYRTLADFATMNPAWPMWALAGVILEGIDALKPTEHE